MTYLEDSIKELKGAKFKLEKDNVLGNSYEPLILPTNNIAEIFGSKISSGSNNGEYRIADGYSYNNSKKVFQANMDGREIFFTTNKKFEKVILPSREYIDYFLNVNNLYDMSDKCIIQINLSQEIKSVRAMNSDGAKIAQVDIISVSKDGTLSSVVSKNTEKLFIIGYENGVIDYRIFRSDTLNQLGQAFCSKNTYFVEQF